MTLQAAIDYLQETVVAGIGGIRKAPADPPESLHNLFPFAVAYASSGQAVGGRKGYGSLTATHDIVLEIHLARKNLPRDAKMAYPFGDSVPMRLLHPDYRTLGGNVQKFTSLDYTFGPLQWGERDMHTIGWRFTLRGCELREELVTGYTVARYCYGTSYETNSLVFKIDADAMTLTDTLALTPSDDANVRRCALDADNNLLYLVLEGTPGAIVKVDLATFTRSARLDLDSGDNNPRCCAIDTDNQLLYVGCYTSPGRVVKIDLATFTRSDAVACASKEDSLRAMCLDADNQQLYAGTATNVGMFVKFDLATFTRTGRISFETGEGYHYDAVADSSAGYAYVGSASKLIKVNLATFARVGSLTCGADALAIDAAGGYLYCGGRGEPGRVVKVDLATFTIADTLTLDADDSYPGAAWIDLANEELFLGCGTDPFRVVKVDLATFTRAGACDGAAGEFCYAVAVD